MSIQGPPILRHGFQFLTALMKELIKNVLK